MMLKLKLRYFGHLMQRVDSLEKTLMLGGWLEDSKMALTWKEVLSSQVRWGVMLWTGG